MDEDYDSQQSLGGDSQPFAGLDPLRRVTDNEASDSEDEALSSIDPYADLSIPQSMKNILAMDSSSSRRDMNANNLEDDSDTDNESLYKTPVSHKVDIAKLNAEVAKNRNKYANFPLLPSAAAAAAAEEEEKAETATAKKTRKPREKKKRREKGKKPDVDIFELQEKARNRNLSKVFEKFAKENESDDDDDDEVKLKKKKKKGGRRTRKEQALNENVVDENGERLIRTTEYLDTDTDDSSEEDDERALSKKEELEMTREQERLRRSANARLKPALVVKSYDEFLKRREQRESDMLASLETSSQREIEQKIYQQQQQQNKSKTQSLKNDDDDDDDDDDLIIENDPAELAAAAMRSPERSKIPLAAHLSPLRQSTFGIRNHNKTMLNRITTEGYEHRMKMEENAKARGHFASATERAKRLLEKEKNARMIDAQVKSHFEKYGYANQHEDEDEEEEEEEEDEDYQEEEEEAHGEEDEDSEDEFAIKDFQVDLSHKRKNSISDDEDDEEQDADVAVKRWKGKKTRKSIFDDSDDEEDTATKKVAKLPVPAHSISNFFKSKVR